MPKKCSLGMDVTSQMLKKHVRALRRPLDSCRAETPDGIHDVRVASRRLRSVLTIYGQNFDKPSRNAFQVFARRITRDLGRARELDVSITLLERYRKRLKGPPRYAATHILRQIRELRKAESATLAACVTRVDDDLDRLLMPLFEELGPARKCVIDEARKGLEASLSNLKRQHVRWRDAPSPEHLHRIRIRTKKFRYACELFAALYGADFVEFIERLKAMQESLGDWNDCRVLDRYVNAEADGALPRTAEGFPALHELLEREIATHQTAYEAQAEAFFSREHRRQTHALLADPTPHCCRKRPKKKKRKPSARKKT